MDENTRAVVASNLTAAFYMRRGPVEPSPLPATASKAMRDKARTDAVEVVATVYKDFLSLLAKGR